VLILMRAQAPAEEVDAVCAAVHAGVTIVAVIKFVQHQGRCPIPGASDVSVGGVMRL